MNEVSPSAALADAPVSTTTATTEEASADYVPETRFGAWFLGTDVWLHFVIKVAVMDLARLMGSRKRAYPVVVDAGCGRGQALRLLKIFFRAGRLVGVDMDGPALDVARRRVTRHRLEVELLENDCSKIDLPDASVDLVFCHQTLHHLVHQEKALDELYRILKPGGVLLLSESTREYIHSWVIKLLFAHPMDVQKTSDEYLALLRRHGFEFDDENVSYPYLWWSRRDFGILEALGIPPRKHGEREETLVNVAARKPG
jgi:ubiquinone/menaquinone biosynthesis C-methylase UbiE